MISLNIKKLFIETYGCQMNVSDSEVVASILTGAGYTVTEQIEEASLVLINTCSVRENAENKVLQRLQTVKKLRATRKQLLIGVIGCMAERMKEQLLEKSIDCDIVAGPDAYKSLPDLVQIAEGSRQAINVHLSDTETYSDINPMRLGNNKITAFVSIMRGCDKFCSYCIVPYTRGRERSRDAVSIFDEVKRLVSNGYKEVTLLGQNVNSYSYMHNGRHIHFHDLLAGVAEIDSSFRVRFTTSHPKDFSNELIDVIAGYPNVCRYVHLPFQAGSNEVLKRMNRSYTREWYLERIETLRARVPGCNLSTDILTGFCGETDEQHLETLSLMEAVKFDQAFMFMYSNRPGTMADKKLRDDIPEAVKKERLSRIIELQNSHSLQSNQNEIGRTLEVLAEGYSKKSDADMYGRTSENKVAIFPKGNTAPGDVVHVQVEKASQASLIGRLVQ
jgi:tRNA-2-methylthio-N6-dimethylallyladenosine synthase